MSNFLNKTGVHRDRFEVPKYKLTLNKDHSFSLNKNSDLIDFGIGFDLESFNNFRGINIFTHKINIQGCCFHKYKTRQISENTNIV